MKSKYTAVINERGHAHFDCALPDGPMILFTKEVTKDNILSSSATWSLALSENNGTCNRITYSVEPAYRNLTLGGNISRIDETGIHFNSLHPDFTLHISVLTFDCMLKLYEDNNTLSFEVSLWKERYENLQSRFTDLEEKVDMIFNAPGMPGAIMAETHFYETLKDI